MTASSQVDAPRGRLAALADSAGPALLAMLVFLVLWQVGVSVFSVRPFILPSPIAVLTSFWDNRASIGEASVATAMAFIGGFALATVVGIGLAVLIVAAPRIGRGVYPLLIASQTIPVIAIAPLLIIWLGFGLVVKVVIASIIAFFPIVVGAVLGFRSVSPTSIDLMRSLPASRSAIFTKLLFPSALPTIFAGLRTGSVLAVVGSVVGEFVAGGDGIASHIITARSQFQTDRVMADIVALALLGAAFYGVVALAEHFALPWKHQSFRPGRVDTAGLSRPAHACKGDPQ